MKIKKGDIITVSSRDEDTAGVVTRVTRENGYKTVHYTVDGMEYSAGTGGHLGDSWVDVYGRPACVSVRQF